LLGRYTPCAAADGLLLGLLLIAGSVGALIVAGWLWTDHAAISPNWNLLLLHPLLVLGLFPALRRPLAVLIALGLAGALLVLVWPGLQYTRDLFAFLAPPLAAAAWRLRGMGRPAS
jgi:hypothetical protein